MERGGEDATGGQAGAGLSNPRPRLRGREIGILLLIAVLFAWLRSGSGEPLRPPVLPAAALPGHVGVPGVPGERGVPGESQAGAQPTRARKFALPTTRGELQTLSQYAGRVLFLNFWATWCRPCVEELPALEALHQELAAEGLAVVAISVDAGSAESVERFAEARGLSFPVLLDPREEVARSYGVLAYPTSFVIDRGGRVVHAAMSAWDWSHPDSVAWFRELLAAPPAAGRLGAPGREPELPAADP